MTIDYKSAGYTAFPFMAVNPLDSEQSIEVLNEKVRPGEVIGHEGMTLRDYFAANAMQAFLANPGGAIQASPMSGWHFCNCDPESVARESYGMADAMLKAREVQS